jgi:predicted negative regulator of RcsB-dependent stress response
MLTLAAKSVGIHVVPGAALLIGGLLSWQLWQQHKKIERNEKVQENVADQFKHMQKELSAIKQQNEQYLKAKKPLSALFKTSSKVDDKGSKYGLFKQLITDNIALRKTH